jgi:hypothetical protein
MKQPAYNQGRIALLTHPPQMKRMRRPTSGWTSIPLVRHLLVALGFLLIALTPLVGPIPGPGGIIVFGAGLSLILKYTGWAKRLYVRFKRKHPKKGSWADWSLRRASARRRHERSKLAEAASPALAEAQSSEPSEAPRDPVRHLSD